MSVDTRSNSSRRQSLVIDQARPQLVPVDWIEPMTKSLDSKPRHPGPSSSSRRTLLLPMSLNNRQLVVTNTLALGRHGSKPPTHESILWWPRLAGSPPWACHSWEINSHCWGASGKPLVIQALYTVRKVATSGRSNESVCDSVHIQSQSPWHNSTPSWRLILLVREAAPSMTMLYVWTSGWK